MTRESGRLSASSIAIVAIWFGLASGIAEAGVNVFRQSVLGTFMVMNRDFPWMIPLAAVLTFAALALAAILLVRLPFGRYVAVLMLAFVAAWGPLTAAGGLAGYAVNLLALGLAVQIGRASGWQIEPLSRLARRTIAGLGGFVLAVMAVMLLSAFLGERRATAALPPAASDSPNVVLVVLDTVRATNISAYGYARQTTPALDQLAAQGVVFENALAAAPWTLPSHATLFTGRYPHEHGADWSKPLDSRYPTLAEVLRARGYETGGFSANSLNVTRSHGLDRGFIHFEDLPVSLGRLALSTSIGRLIVSNGSLMNWLNYHDVVDRQPAGTITDASLAWLAANKGRPFFLFLNFFDAHDPYFPPDPFATQFGPRRPATTQFWHTGVASWPVDRQKMSARAHQAELDAYDGAIAYMDAQLNRLAEYLKAKGLLDRTLLIVTADHGEQLGEHNLFNHGNSLYRPVMHVPLVMRMPGRISSGLRVAQPVSLRDLPGTILDLVTGSTTQAFPGQSLAPASRGESLPAGAVFSEATRRPFGSETGYPLLQGDMRSVVSEGYEYIRNTNGSEELFDLDHDVAEMTNLVQSPPHAAVLEKLRRLIDAGGPAPAGRE